jgi:hypothetical protein
VTSALAVALALTFIEGNEVGGQRSDQISSRGTQASRLGSELRALGVLFTASLSKRLLGSGKVSSNL